MDELIGRALNLHENMGNDLAALGGVLRCKVCGAEQTLTGADISRYLAQGWPKHCGTGMRWLTAKELAAERRDADHGGR